MQEEGTTQHPVYNISHTLKGVEVRYPRIETLTFALVIATRMFYSYFQAHTIKVLTLVMSEFIL